MRGAGIVFATALLLFACSAPSGLPVVGSLVGDEGDGWTRASAEALVQYAGAMDAHGVDPARYDMAAIDAALASHDRAALNAAADALFVRIAHDLDAGVAAPAERGWWKIADRPAGAAAIDAARADAARTGDVAAALDAFAPSAADYAALKAALPVETDPARREKIALNLERWRWLPHDLGADYILANIPSFDLVYVRGGAPVARHRIIAGARRTPTPVFETEIVGVIANPTWRVPASIVRESVGALMANEPAKAEALGYYRAPDGGVRQKPGPANALGRLKFDMPNPYSVFIHDTPNRNLFERDARALSHGCMRLEDPAGLANRLLAEEESRAALAAALASGAPAKVALAAPVPVYVAYFTMRAGADEAGAVRIEDFSDVYGVDAAALAPAGGGVPCTD